MVKGFTPEQEKIQLRKEEMDFRYNTNITIQEMVKSIDALKEIVNEYIAKHGVHKVETKLEVDKISDSVKTAQKSNNEALDLQFQILQQSSANICIKTADFGRLRERLQKLETEIPKMQKETIVMQEELKVFKEEITNLVRSMSSEYERKIEAFKKEILSRPSEIAGLKKDLEEQINIVSLNGTNSMIRSTNNEKQLYLIEKKIEMINLILKKQELDRQ